jgi:hypothetical protein
LTQEDIVRRGMVANAILQSEDNQWFYTNLKALILDSITQTKPEQTEERERLYFSYRAIDDLLGTMQSYVDASNAIQSNNESISD